MTDLDALTLTIWGEARGEPIEGQIGVAMVIRNRVLSNYRGAKTYADVCLAPSQFSCWTEEPRQMNQAAAGLASGSIDAPLTLCQDIARATIAGSLADNTGGANHYLTTDLFINNPPSWAKGATGRPLGAQTFLRLA